METKRVSEGTQSTEQHGAHASANLEAAAAFSKMLDMLIAAGAAGSGDQSDPFSFAALEAPKEEEPVVEEEPVIEEEPVVDGEELSEADDQSDDETMQTEKAKPEQAPVVAICHAPVEALPEAPMADAPEEALPTCQTQPQIAPECTVPDTEVSAPEVQEVLQKVQPQVVAATDAVQQPIAKILNTDQTVTQAPVEKAVAEVAPEEVQATAPVVSTPVVETVAKDPTVTIAEKPVANVGDTIPEVAPELLDADAATDELQAPVAANLQNNRAAERALAPKISEGSAAQAFKVQLQALEKTDISSESASGHSTNVGAVSSVKGAQTGNGLFQGPAGLKLAQERSTATKTKESGSKLSSSDQDKVVEKVKELIKNAEANKNGNSFVVRLDPPSLGEMTVKVMHKAGQMFARIVPENAEVEGVLRNRMPELMQTLAASGINTDNVHVSIGGERSETEQFNQFFNQSGSNRSSGNESSRGQSDGRLFSDTTASRLAEQHLEARQAAQQPGWVA